TYRVDFSEPLLLPSVDAGDLLVSGVAAQSVTAIDPDTLEFTIASADVGEGAYTVTVPAGVLTSLTGKAVTAFTATFDVDLTPPTVVASSLGESEVVPVGSLTITVQF